MNCTSRVSLNVPKCLVIGRAIASDINSLSFSCHSGYVFWQSVKVQCKKRAPSRESRRIINRNRAIRDTIKGAIQDNIRLRICVYYRLLRISRSDTGTLYSCQWKQTQKNWIFLGTLEAPKTWICTIFNLSICKIKMRLWKSNQYTLLMFRIITF